MFIEVSRAISAPGNNIHIFKIIRKVLLYQKKTRNHWVLISQYCKLVRNPNFTKILDKKAQNFAYEGNKIISYDDGDSLAEKVSDLSRQLKTNLSLWTGRLRAWKDGGILCDGTKWGRHWEWVRLRKHALPQDDCGICQGARMHLQTMFLRHHRRVCF